MASRDSAPDALPATTGGSSPFRLLAIVWLGAVVFLSPAFRYAGFFQFQGSMGFFLIRQDLPVLVAFLVLIPSLGLVPAVRWPALTHSFAARPLAWTIGLAVLAAIIGAAAEPAVFGGYVISTDEFLANFDARIFAHGELMAPVDPRWRPYVAAMQPAYMLPTPGHAFWASGYLPVNAALRALALKLGAETLLNPLLSAVGVVATYGVGRQIWPDDKRPALIAAALLAVSPQLIVMSMTAYAMPAHLALNMVWLWLFLRGGRLGHFGAIVVGFLASGLHELAFHPIFAAPFVLQLWLDRRWRLAGLYTLAYAGICLFWIEYWPLEQRIVGLPPAAAHAAGGGFFLQKVLRDFGAFSLNNAFATAESLIRFIVWQAPLTAPLGFLSIAAAIRAKGVLRSLMLGVLLTLALTIVVTPAQVHGWGFRYFHGLLGGICLVAAWTWIRLTDALPAAGKAAANTAFVASCALSLVVFVPIRAWQAWSYVRPYAAAHAAIEHAPADVVIVADDGPTFFDTGSVMRNDPFLKRGPKVMALPLLDPLRLMILCATQRVAVFDGADGARLGIDVFRLPPDPAELALRQFMRSRRCGVPVLPPPHLS
ncbi:MAG TPA: hypothetical protein VME40_06550 [Caulobacteraceae bacterium]|nr:hypothetical protein [Caulobacteraceae bacterium]